jgi:Tfp pilus assembly protein PilF
MALAKSQECLCGSGLRRVRCCSLDWDAVATTAATRHLTPLVERALHAHREGDRALAERLALEVLELAPNATEPLSILYEIRKQGGADTAAEALVRRLVRINPNNIVATNELALLLLRRGDLAEAELHARNMVRTAPQNAQSHNLMGMILTEANRPQIGEYHYRRALELSGRRDAILLANLAWNLKNQGKMAEARTLYEESLALQPNVLQTLLGRARLEEADRKFDAAARYLDRADEVSPGNPSLLLARATLHGRMRAYEPALQMLDAIAAQRGERGLGPSELLEQGRLLDQMGRTGDAFAAFAEGKRKARQLTGHTYRAEHAADLARRLKGFFTASRLKTLPRAAALSSAPQPIFILGFPRSGTTLVEQMLSAHPLIAAGDELPFVNDIVNLMPRMLGSPLGYPEALSELWMGDQRDGLDNLRDYYLQRAHQIGTLEAGATWLTDKMPLNEMHLGLIALIFPAAPLIHVLRHPLDVVLSVFSNHLTHGFYCGFDLESAARHYVLILDLVEHYRAELTLRYLPIRYEDIVADQAGALRRLLDFIGASFDPRCLAFHENQRYARTASYAQVTEPLYERSRFRYRRYLTQLAPVIPILQPAIERLGYTVESQP